MTTAKKRICCAGRIKAPEVGGGILPYWERVGQGNPALFRLLDLDHFLALEYCCPPRLEPFYFVMRSFLSFVVNNLTSKAKGPSSSNSTTASEQPSLEEMDVTQDPLPIASHRLKRQASSSSSIEFPRKKRMENPIHPEASITSQTENIGRTVRSPQNSKADKFHQDATMAFSASHELALSKKEYLGREPPGDALPDSSPCSSPVPSLAFDILSSDCDYDDAPLGDILLLDLDNDDSPEVHTTLPMNMPTGSSEGS